MAAKGVPPSSLQEWMGRRDLKTTLIYVDYATGDDERETVTAAFSKVGVNSRSAIESPAFSQVHQSPISRSAA